MTGSQRSSDKLNKTFPSEDAILRGRFWTTCPSVGAGDFGYCGCTAAETGGGGGGSIISCRHDEFLYSLSPPSIVALGDSGQHCDYLVDDTNFQIVLDSPVEEGVHMDEGVDEPGYSFPSEMGARAAREGVAGTGETRLGGHASSIVCGAVNWNGTEDLEDLETSGDGSVPHHCKIDSNVTQSDDLDR